MPSRFARTVRAHRMRRESSSDSARRKDSSSPGAPQGPRAFCFQHPAGGIGIRTCLRNTLFRVRIPGGVPDFPRERMRSRLLFYNLDVAKQAPPRATCPWHIYGPRGGAARAFSNLAVAQPGQRAWFGTMRSQVRILPARPDHTSVAQRKREHAATNRGAEGSNPSGGTNMAP